MKLIIGLVLLTIIAVGAVGLSPDIIRYMKIRSM
jgi:hypothetical protein